MTKMLDVKIIPHRDYLMANTPDQKLFIELKLRANQAAALNFFSHKHQSASSSENSALNNNSVNNSAASASSLSIVFLVDTSGSMREIVLGSPLRTGKTQIIDGNTYDVVRGGDSKIDIIIDGLKKIVESSKLKNRDMVRVSVVKFDDTAKVLLPFINIEDKNKDTILKAVEDLRNYSGGTSMGAGLKTILGYISKETGANKKIIMLTDGQTSDEDLVKETAFELAKEGIPVIAIGIGEDWNEELITFMTDKTQGKPFYATTKISYDSTCGGKASCQTAKEDDGSTDNNSSNYENSSSNSNSNNNYNINGIGNNIAIKPSDIPEVMLKELESAAGEMITGLSLNINTVKDVVIDRITRVYPEISEVDISIKPHSLGSISAKEDTIYILETTIPERSPMKTRLIQLGLAYNVSGANFRDENPPEDIVVEFTVDESKVSIVNQEVMQWVQQRNVGGLLEKAIKEAASNPVTAAKTLDMARHVTVKLGNSAMTKLIDAAKNEISESKTISIDTLKTLRIGSKTKTVRINGTDGENAFSDEQIRKLAGI